MTSAGIHVVAPSTSGRSDLDEVVERACQRIAPTWPLDRFIAVNPFWELVDASPQDVSARLTALSGSRLVMARAFYREEWLAGRIERQDLEAAIAERGARVTLAELEALMHADEPTPRRRARVMDVADSGRDLARRLSWRELVIHNTSQLCASYYDDGQAGLQPSRAGGLYATWQRQALHDRTPGLSMGEDLYLAMARELPASSREMVALAVRDLEIPEAHLESYLWGLLLDLNGWAAFCAYRRWTARLAGKADGDLAELLAIRLAWEWLLLRLGGRSLAAQWSVAKSSWSAIDAEARSSQEHDWLLQRALEIAWQRELRLRLAARPVAQDAGKEPVAVQVVCCIDVRSEVLRRALEAQSPRVQILGFAGFFGMPVEYTPVGAASARPQLPGLLAPVMSISDTGAPGDVAARRTARLSVESAWKQLKTGALTSFAFVESLGLLFGGKLVVDSFGGSSTSAIDSAGLSADEDAARRPRLSGTRDGAEPSVDEKCALAERMLRAMSLTKDFAPLVLLLGHGSSSRNNPYRAGLDCGACCGQTGEVNARAAAALLNEPDVRTGLAARGIVVPETTHFLAGLHDTTTDSVKLFERDLIPASSGAKVQELDRWLLAATEQTRRERAPALGLRDLAPSGLPSALRARSRDWAEVRPEWGLAGNAALIVARRERTRGLDLRGRAFLHEYRCEDDAQLEILELVMTAPMVVAHWINLQYYASTVDNARYGSGQKVLHNVVGGHLGVFEGNGGDLRIGLPLESLHDGERWVHTPLRLSVLIEAPCSAMDAVLQKHEKVRALVENQWVHLFQLDPRENVIRAYRDRAWVSVA